MEHWRYSAENLLAHFHAICHGHLPFSIDWNEESRRIAGVDDQGIEFLKTMKGLVESGGSFLPPLPCRQTATPNLLMAADLLKKRANGSPGQELVWIAALFLPGPDE